MTTREPLILEYRGAADASEGGDAEYGFIREVFGWFLVAFLVVGMLAATMAGMSALVWVIR